MIFLLLFANYLRAIEASPYYDTTGAKIVKAITGSKKLFDNTTNSTNLVLKSFDSSIRIKNIVPSVEFTLIPEPIEYAAYRDPDNINITNYNKTCLKNWENRFNKVVNECIGNDVVMDRNISQRFCEVMNRRLKGNCDKVKKKLTDCTKSVTDLSTNVDIVRFPDGRRIDYIGWNCAMNELCCDWGCCDVAPIYKYTTTVSSSLNEARSVMNLTVKVCLISSVVCALLASLCRVLDRMKKREQIMPALPQKGQEKSSDSTSTTDSSQPPGYEEQPIYPPHVYPPPPAYNDIVISPMPKVA